METAQPKYIVGIDLGTTHCVLAYTSTDVPEHEPPDVRLLEIPQVVGAGEVQAQPLLPSFLLLPGPHDVPEGALALPWNAEADAAVGVYARERGAELPTRLVSSAKSWLSHTGVDRTSAILPWNAPEDARRVSPVEASVRYLAHLRDAWNERMAQEDPDVRLETQEIYLTVPASFDPVARELTVRAAREAGFENLTLLEEPQAAFYAWIRARGADWREAVEVGESVLVCDVGGGTTDLSLIEVVEEEGNLELRRAAVGNHVLLGGDNMDLTLAYAVRAKLAQNGTGLDQWQFRALAQQCRKAKECLLGNPDLEAEPISLLGRGSSLIGGTIRTELTREEVERALVDGFFPDVEADARPQRQAQGGRPRDGAPLRVRPGGDAPPRRVPRTADVRRRRDAVPLGGPLQRRGDEGEPPPRARPRRAPAVERQRRPPRASFRRPRPRRGARGGLLRCGPTRARHPHPGRRGALVLHRRRERDAGGARRPHAHQRPLRRPLRDGGGD